MQSPTAMHFCLPHSPHCGSLCTCTGQWSHDTELFLPGGEFTDTLAEVAEGPVLLPPGALVALHGEVARPLRDVEVLLALPALPDLLLPLPHLVVLLPLASLLLGHLETKLDTVLQLGNFSSLFIFFLHFYFL